MKKLYPLFIAVTALLAACQAEVEDLREETKTCKIETGLFYGGGGALFDSATFIYDMNGKLTKVETDLGFYSYSYNGDKLVSRKYFEGADLWWEDSVYWDGNNVSQYIQFDYSNSSPEESRYILQYAGGKLSRVLWIDMYPDWVGGGMLVDTFPTNVYWNAAGNIEKLVYLDEFGDAVDSISYQYDNNTNFFKVVSPHFYLFDPIFALHAGFEPHLPYYYSKNNVIGFTIYDGFNYSVEYGLDSLNKMTSVNMDGEEYIKYQYRCN